MPVADHVLMILNEKLDAEVDLDDNALMERAGSLRGQSCACYGAPCYPSQMSADPMSEPIVKSSTDVHKTSGGNG